MNVRRRAAAAAADVQLSRNSRSRGRKTTRANFCPHKSFIITRSICIFCVYETKAIRLRRRRPASQTHTHSIIMHINDRTAGALCGKLNICLRPSLMRFYVRCHAAAAAVIGSNVWDTATCKRTSHVTCEPMRSNCCARVCDMRDISCRVWMCIISTQSHHRGYGIDQTASSIQFASILCAVTCATNCTNQTAHMQPTTHTHG